MRRILFAIAAALFTCNLQTAGAETVSVPIDESKLVAFQKGFSTIYVANPSIADITVVDQHHVFVLGKTFGITNLLALGPKGELVASMPLSVEGHAGQTVTLHMGLTQLTYDCHSGRCEAAPVPGDAKLFYEMVHNENVNREDLAQRQAGAH